MKQQNSKWIYLLIGVGCGMIVSGIFMVIIGLQATKELSDVRSQGNLPKEITTSQALGTYQQVKEQKVASDKSTSQNTENAMQSVSEDTNTDVRAKEVNIPSHYTATQVSKLLEAEGVVEDGQAFLEYLRAEKATTKLQTGIKIIPIDGDYQAILTVLLGKSE